ncbi:protein adenylyltransferase SelO [Alteromonas sp. ASW11-130]|uniref:protein adenylyltransferase SelO n=1 Tax=Alteromonas sp. ASW11-130 TaxID=3015775 RepID=UPI0022426DE0|nr:protein adenylyltransferase SelO family protein [Alteromonas sp. ASW11-130]MCW8092707.1 protein adenylyltransferase SelO family protein [Alteromonas sp. ASW11-130]
MTDTLMKSPKVTNLVDFAKLTDYSLLSSLSCDPQSTPTGEDYNPRQVFSGHYVPIKTTPLNNPVYLAHSKTLFEELGFADELAHTDEFIQMFSGDMSWVPEPMKKVGWATGYALSIYGTEYIQQCPFQTGNGYGDGRAMSVVELVANRKRWEMQLKGGGRTPYCRGADGRAVLRSSVREFLAQEHMHALGVPTSRSLSLIMSQTDTVDRPWYLEGSTSENPEVMMANPVAITTRVASSFLRVGQLELFGRRARSDEHDEAMPELTAIVQHLIKREYPNDVDTTQPFANQILQLAEAFCQRLTSLTADWLRVGYCQGNFNSDNCAAGGFTLDYGPFGFCEKFDPAFQPWTGGGQHFSFFNQPAAAFKNYEMFCRALAPLLADEPDQLSALETILNNFPQQVEAEVNVMWAAKLGMDTYDSELLVSLLQLMVRTQVDYTMFFRELSSIPESVADISQSFYKPVDEPLSNDWNRWLATWRSKALDYADVEFVSAQMKQVNPKYTWREWLIVPAYQQAAQGDASLINELQQVLTRPYDEQSSDIEDKYYRLRPDEFMHAGGISHYSCSS